MFTQLYITVYVIIISLEVNDKIRYMHATRRPSIIIQTYYTSPKGPDFIVNTTI